MECFYSNFFLKIDSQLFDRWYSFKIMILRMADNFFDHHRLFHWSFLLSRSTFWSLFIQNLFKKSTKINLKINFLSSNFYFFRGPLKFFVSSFYLCHTPFLYFLLSPLLSNLMIEISHPFKAQPKNIYIYIYTFTPLSHPHTQL